MTTATVLPDIEECIDLYLVAHHQFGTEQFDQAQLESTVSTDEFERLLDLSVAYGLFATDGNRYRISCEPEMDGECWNTVVSERVNQIQEGISNQLDEHKPAQSRNTPMLEHNGQMFSSVFVAESEAYDSVIESVDNVFDSGSAGIVLRSPGEYANEVQGFADLLCDPGVIEATSLSTHFQKEYSDVVGDDKNELEFRLYLSSA